MVNEIKTYWLEVLCVSESETKVRGNRVKSTGMLHMYFQVCRKSKCRCGDFTVGKVW